MSIYIKATKAVDKTVSHNILFLQNKFNPKVTDTNKKLPNIYWTLKLHKTFTKARFIIAAPKWPVKPLPKAFTVLIKPTYKRIENYNKKTQYHFGFKTFWPVQNIYQLINQTIIDTINKLKSKHKTISISTPDFYTLYTNISHQKLKSVTG